VFRLIAHTGVAVQKVGPMCGRDEGDPPRTEADLNAIQRPLPLTRKESALPLAAFRVDSPNVAHGRLIGESSSTPGLGA